MTPPAARHRGRDRRAAAHGDEGRAIIEVVFLAVLLLIPTIYILLGVLRLQSATMAVSQAARDVGRLVETSPSLPSVEEAATVARVALKDQHVDSGRMRVVTTAAGGDCANAQGADFSRAPGSDYDVCVVAVITLPGVPTVLSGSKNTVTGIYTVHIGALREG